MSRPCSQPKRKMRGLINLNSGSHKETALLRARNAVSDIFHSAVAAVITRLLLVVTDDLSITPILLLETHALQAPPASMLDKLFDNG